MNILVFSQYYPFEGDLSPERTTKAVHYFAREWKNDGHRVIIIHNHLQESKYLLCMNNILKKEGTKQRINKPIKSVIDGIESFLLPISRSIPKSNYLNKYKVFKQIELIEEILINKDFVPDLLFCHFPISQLQIIEEFSKKNYCKTIFTFHKSDIMYLKRKRKNKVIRKIQNSNVEVAFRSESLKKSFEEMGNLEMSDSYIAYSGAPSMCNNYLATKRKKKLNLLYVGNLIQQKNVQFTIRALHKLKSNNYEFTFNIIGKGPYEHDLKILTKTLQLDEHVHFHGYRPREEVLEFMKNTDVFIMVSSPETFGIVYIEAMGQGCIVVGSKGEGIDGVIINKKNGYLVTPKNATEISWILEQLYIIPDSEYYEVLYNSVGTAKDYTETNVARNYLNRYISYK